ncbi:DUF3263 domain-containing protein [Phycicoccus avicenniae]|uniref:DUF3263 domain-containing protein n=1 Tax=Phycicoccus avicenniae TaxID=2828860 RepID=UPI003D2E97E4
MTLSDVVAMERRFPGVDDGRKTAAVLAEHGLSMTRYQQRLNALVDDPAFVVTMPAHARLLRQRRARLSRGRRLTSAG